MSTRFDTQPRFSAAGVTTAAVLIMILAMGISTLRPSEAPQAGVAAGSSPAQVAQAHHQKPVKKS
jgi:hypothetical protein